MLLILTHQVILGAWQSVYNRFILGLRNERPMWMRRIIHGMRFAGAGRLADDNPGFTGQRGFSGWMASTWSVPISTVVVNSPSSSYGHPHPFVLVSPFSFPKFFCQNLTKRTHGESIFIGIWYELMFCIHLKVFHASVWGSSTCLPNLATHCYVWQLFSKTVHQIWPRFNPVHLPSFLTSSPTLDLAKILELKIAQTYLINQTHGYVFSIPCRRVHMREELCYQYLVFYAASVHSIWFTPDYTLHDKLTLNFPSPNSVRFLLLIHLAMPARRQFPSIRFLAISRILLVAVSIQLGLLQACFIQWDTHQRNEVVLARNPQWTQILRGECR